MAKQVLVTGGTQGVGRETVMMLAEKGYEVHLTYRKSAEQAQELVRQYEGRVFAHRLDQGDLAQVEQADFLVEHPWYGVIFNAGLGSATVKSYAPQGDCLDAANDVALMTVNALGPLWIYKKMKPMLEQKTEKTKLIFLSSVDGGVAAFPHFTLSDGMSKAAVAFLAKQLAAENVYTPIDVFCVSPGSMETGMFYASTLQYMTPEVREQFARHQAKNRLIQPRDVAYWLCELLKDESTLLHGANIDASMGLGCRTGIQTEFQPGEA